MTPAGLTFALLSTLPAVLLLSASAVAAEALAVPAEIDAASVTWFPDQGRLELKGAHLSGLRIAWKADARVGEDVCLDPKTPAGSKDELCAFALPRDLPADVSLSWLPAAP